MLIFCYYWEIWCYIWAFTTAIVSRDTFYTFNLSDIEEFDSLAWSTQFQIVVRPWDARFLGNQKTRVAQNSCNLSYLIRQRQGHQKTVQLKVFTTWICASQIFLNPIQKCALSRSVQLEAVYLKALLYVQARTATAVLGSGKQKNYTFKAKFIFSHF